MTDVADKQWEDRVKTLLKVELKRQNVTYAELAGKLADVGVMDSGRISGTRSAGANLQRCFWTMSNSNRVDTLRLE